MDIMEAVMWIYSLMLLTIPVSVTAQGRLASRAEIDSIMNPPLLDGKGALCFETTTINIGRLSEDDKPVSYRFYFRNTSKETIVLTRVSTSCGCTTASFTKKPVKPGEKGIIELTFNPFEQVGKLNKRAFLYTNLSERYPTEKITLSGEVTPTSNEWREYPYSMGNVLRLRQSTVAFNELPRNATRVERLVCVNSSRTSLHLSAMIIPRYAMFRTEPEIIEPGKEADIVITIDSRLLPPVVKNEFTFPVIIKGIDSKPSERTIYVKVSLQNE